MNMNKLMYLPRFCGIFGGWKYWKNVLFEYDQIHDKYFMTGLINIVIYF